MGDKEDRHKIIWPLKKKDKYRSSFGMTHILLKQVGSTLRMRIGILKLNRGQDISKIKTLDEWFINVI